MSDGKPEWTPLLAPGFHVLTMSEMRVLCVDAFPASLTRPALMANLDELVSLLLKANVPGKIWIDGSFVTGKPNPDDVDFLLEMSEAERLAMDPEANRVFEWFAQSKLQPSHKLDNYYLVRSDAPEAEYLYAYWLRQFGFSRAQEMKGIVVIDLAATPQEFAP